MGVVHHDMKPANVLIDSEGHCRVSDFGGARFLSNGRLSFTGLKDIIITRSYAAPELFRNVKDSADPYYDEAIDYWSLGATMAILIIDRESFTGTGDFDKIQAQVERVKRRMIRRGSDELLVQFVMDLLQFYPSKRLRGSVIKEHPYFIGIGFDWHSVSSMRYPPFSYHKNTFARAHGYGISSPPPAKNDTRYNLMKMLEDEGIELPIDDSFDVDAEVQGMTCDL
ncbi:Chromosomal serine/threonine-protein kinase JIL-1 [Grifola frondosa]|uniref:Chromosomal serine/threonine-protein kinase JIL-1 n=1 Tax=Grifola frondosa TaxID=5627 RepID=A0A1C7MIJ7_GRIFR|nr:Chromosomal serine/threonine-protein kinase JIL-1 [Grifola frondosa]